MSIYDDDDDDKMSKWSLMESVLFSVSPHISPPCPYISVFTCGYLCYTYILLLFQFN